MEIGKCAGKNMANSIIIKNSIRTEYETIHEVNFNGDIIIVNDSPFGNCQIFGIKYFDILIDCIEDIKQLHDTIKDIRNVCGIYKPLCMVDITYDVYEDSKDYLNLKCVSPYTSSNTSEMVMALIETRFKKRIKKDKETN